MQPIKSFEIHKVNEAKRSLENDLLVTEEPLEIRLGFGPMENRQEMKLSVTMRTPGNDFELALGFLWNEGIIEEKEHVLKILHCAQVKHETEKGNVVRVELIPTLELDPTRFQRHFYASSSCGVCGKGSIEAVHSIALKVFPENSWRPSADFLHKLNRSVSEGQVLFNHTGGIHAAVLFDKNGRIILQREDIGRHNAVDKVTGAFLMGDFQMQGGLLWVSGRAGFELVQKCITAGFPAMAAVGAPSSLAVELARAYNLYLAGFLREDRFNEYSPLN